MAVFNIPYLPKYTLIKNSDFFKGGSTQNQWVLINDFSKGGSRQNRWGLMGDFSKGGVHKTDGFWYFFYCFWKLSARGVYFGKYGIIPIFSIRFKFLPCSGIDLLFIPFLLIRLFKYFCVKKKLSRCTFIVERVLQLSKLCQFQFHFKFQVSRSEVRIPVKAVFGDVIPMTTCINQSTERAKKSNFLVFPTHWCSQHIGVHENSEWKVSNSGFRWHSKIRDSTEKHVERRNEFVIHQKKHKVQTIEIFNSKIGNTKNLRLSEQRDKKNWTNS